MMRTGDWILCCTVLASLAGLAWLGRWFRTHRDEEAGTPEPLDVNDEMAIAEAVEKDDFGIWESECARLQRLADKLGTRSTP